MRDVEQAVNMAERDQRRDVTRVEDALVCSGAQHHVILIYRRERTCGVLIGYVQCLRFSHQRSLSVAPDGALFDAVRANAERRQNNGGGYGDEDYVSVHNFAGELE